MKKRYCGKCQIWLEDRFCPKCGAEGIEPPKGVLQNKQTATQKTPFNWKLPMAIILPILLLVVLLGIIEHAKKTEKSKRKVANKSQNSHSTQSSHDRKPLYYLSAVELTREYDQNEVAANNKYKGKYVCLSGKVDSIDETFGKPVVTLEGDNYLKILCYFSNEDRTRVSVLAPGDAVVITGRVTGKSLGGGAVIHDAEM